MEIVHIFEIIGFTSDIVGKVMVAFTAVMVHHRFWKEHKIDEQVFRAMKRERMVGIIGILLMVAGFLLQFPAKFLG
jgi:hypothetical protein